MLFRSLAIAAGISVLAFVCAAVPVSTDSPITTTTEPASLTAFTIDSAHSTLTYRVRHMDVAYFHGRINKPAGTFTLDDADLSGSSVQITAEIANMDSGNEGRDRFLTGPQLFNAAQFPTLEFHSTAIRKISGGTYEASGDFTMHGETRTITVRLDEYTTKQTERMGHRAGFECTFTIKRSDYGMDLFVKEGTLGDEVRITVAIEGVAR